MFGLWVGVRTVSYLLWIQGVCGCLAVELTPNTPRSTSAGATTFAGVSFRRSTPHRPSASHFRRFFVAYTNFGVILRVCSLWRVLWMWAGRPGLIVAIPERGYGAGVSRQGTGMLRALKGEGAKKK
jgi:hypothetical protein